ncbi:tyrosine-type recombinase/integrase [Parasphingorhabdus cellanae]|uniref:tyrosine-type recombinase/integrase n=1 Tax=Parasphingorhabdus cellanae TaxID=2806553 RepID=UPI001FB09ABE|nr:site-specific integrase [Parasphingorhabdus cellanae]
MGKLSKTVLSKKIFADAQPREKRYELWDANLPGFGVRITVSGLKTYIVRYRADGGDRSAPRRFVTVGRANIITLDQARKKARALLAQVLLGEDPAAERNAKRLALNISELVDIYESEGCYIQRGKRQGEPMKELTKRYTLARLRHHVVPLLGKRRASEILSGHIENFVRDVAAGKTTGDQKLGPRRRVIVRGGEGAARKVFRDLSAVFSFAQRRGIVDSNPCEHAAVRKTDNQNNRYLTKEEGGRLGAACDTLEAQGANRKGIDIVRLWALTGCRRQEIAELKWSEIDFERGLLVLEDTKTGKSIRPLGAAALALLQGIEQTENSEFVFPADYGGGHFQGMKGIWKKIIDTADLPGVTPHTLRHTLASLAISSGEAMALTDAILGHANPRSTAILRISTMIHLAKRLIV